MMRPPEGYRNTVYKYTMRPESLVGDVNKASKMDIMTLYVINLGDPNQQTDVRFLQIINTIFSEGMDDKTRDKVLSEKYDVHIDLELAKEVRKSMFEQEYDYWVQYGSKETMVQNIIALMETMDLDVEKAMDALKVPDISKNRYRSAVKAKIISS